MKYRSIDTVETLPPAGAGFDGPHHSAVRVIAPGNFQATDPFFLMMDDRVNRKGPLGGEHPHAGLETVTFILSGSSEDLGKRMEEGDVEWMTAGSGIVHAEDTVVSDNLRLLQLWVVLPESQRHIAPRVQQLARDEMPVRREPGVVARVYSGRSGGVEAATINAVPVTLVDIHLESGARFEQDLPSSYNCFVLVLDGLLRVGDAAAPVSAGQIGWSHPVDGDVGSALALVGGPTGARALLYAGEPQRTPIAARGPFIAGSESELNAFFSAYRQGQFPRASSMRRGEG